MQHHIDRHRFTQGIVTISAPPTAFRGHLLEQAVTAAGEHGSAGPMGPASTCQGNMAAMCMGLVVQNAIHVHLLQRIISVPSVVRTASNSMSVQPHRV